MTKLNRIEFLEARTENRFDIILGEEYNCTDEIYQLNIENFDICVLSASSNEPQIIESEYSTFLFANNTVLTISKQSHEVVKHTVGLSIYEIVRNKNNFLVIADCEILCCNPYGAELWKKELSGILQDYEIKDDCIFASTDDKKKIKIML